MKESSANLTVELPKPWSEGLARLAASAHLHYRVGSSLISEEIVRQNTKPFAKRTTGKGELIQETDSGDS